MGIPVLALAIMFDHLHSLGVFSHRQQMADFVRNHLSFFAMAYNQDIGRKGNLFEKAYGNAPKWTLKKIRSTIIYIGNNHVEKGLCERAEEYRWSLVAYLGNDHPYSERIHLKKASARLRRNLKAVDAFVRQNTVIPYPVLRKYYQGLSAKEYEQFTDYLISKYNPIDKELVLSFFEGSYETFLLALHSTTGSDYDIKESYDIPSHQPYVNLLELCARSSFRENPKAIQTVSSEIKGTIATKMESIADASKYEIGKFLDLAYPSPSP